MARNKLIAFTCAAVMACTLFAGCGSSSAGNSQDLSVSQNSASVSASSISKETETPAASGTGDSASTAGEKHLNAALYWFGTSLDPATEYDGWTTCRAGITETLVTVDKNYELQPLLASSFSKPYSMKSLAASLPLTLPSFMSPSWIAS